eukprot:1008301-Pleurochrysis_carterae.AAC.1
MPEGHSRPGATPQARPAPAFALQTVATVLAYDSHFKPGARRLLQVDPENESVIQYTPALACVDRYVCVDRSERHLFAQTIPRE